MTSTALDLNHAPAALAIQPGQIAWDATQLAALSQLGLADAGDGDRAVFLHVCQRTGLDPFARQIYMIARREKVPGSQNQWRNRWTIQTGIDGFRVNRDRAEKKAGMRGVLGRAVFYDPEGNEHKAWLHPRPPVACEITYTVRDRDGSATPYTSVLRFTEYAQVSGDGNLIAQWKDKPAHMLEKCTEADVYRKAFPQDFSGIYLEDEAPPPQQQDAPAAVRQRGPVTVAEVTGREPGPERPAAAAPDGTPASGPAAAAGPDGGAPEDQPGSASGDQLASLHIILGGLGFGADDREAKLRIAETVTGRAPLTGPHPGRSSKNLSFTEARTLAGTLGGFDGDREKLIAYMAQREQGGDGGG